jgi:hypothetical protein
VIDPQTPPFDFPVSKKVEVWTENIADLVEQAKLGQWNAATDISWRDLGPLPTDLERAVCHNFRAGDLFQDQIQKRFDIAARGPWVVRSDSSLQKTGFLERVDSRTHSCRCREVGR